MTFTIPSKKDIITDILLNGCDAQHLYLISGEDLEKLVSSNNNSIDEDIFFHWENCQEELRIMMDNI